MLVEKILGNISDYPLESKTIDKVLIEWYELDKKLLRKTSQLGEEVGIRLSEHLLEGDVLYDDGKKVVVTEILPCELTTVEVHSMKEMGRLCFELGNRHLSLSIGEKKVSVPYDEPTFKYLEKLGFAPKKEIGKFTNFTVCHAHGHSHGQEGQHTQGQHTHGAHQQQEHRHE